MSLLEKKEKEEIGKWVLIKGRYKKNWMLKSMKRL